MDFFGLGDTISYNDYNMIVYLLRKFKRLTSDLKLGSNSIESDYGVYSVTGGLTSVGGNFILEDDVTISSNDVLLNCFYTFYFTVVDVNLSGTVNRRVVSVTGDTGDDGVLEVVLEPSLLESDEVILPDFKVDIVFDEHEYYTPVSSLDITLSVDKEYITVGESNTVTATVLDDSGEPVEDLELQFSFNGDIVTDITDEDGVASASYTGTGAGGVTVTVSGKSIRFYDGCMVATVTGNNITLGYMSFQWLDTNGNVIIDWGDGTTTTVNNPQGALTHNYTDGEQSHDITFIGGVNKIGDYCFRGTTVKSIYIPSTVTSLGDACFDDCTGLTSIVIPDSVTSLGRACFDGCTGLTSIVIPDSVTSLGEACFRGCSNLTSVTIPSSVTSLGRACFQWCSSLTSITIPERVTGLGQDSFFGCSSLTSVTIPDNVTSIGYRCFYGCTGLTSIVIPDSVTSLGNKCFYNCGSLVDYQLYWESSDILTYDPTKMPNNTNTVFTIPYGETSNYTAKNYPSSKLVERSAPVHTYSLSIASDKSSILTTDSVTLTGTLLMDSTGYSGQSVALYDGATLVDTLTTDSNGEYSKTLTGLSAGTHTFKAVNTNAESSTITVTVTEPTPVHNYSITITGDSIIQTGDNDNITATLKDNGVVVSGETLNYQIKHGNTVIASGSDTTDTNGEISFNYVGTGVGDVDVIVSYGSLLQETYELTDYIKIGFNDWTGTYTTGTDTYDYITPTGTDVSPNVTLPSSFKVNYKFKNTNTSGSQSSGSGLWNIGADTNNGILIGHETSNRRIRAYIRTNGTNSAQTPINNVYEYNTWTDVEIIYNNGSISLSVGGQTISYSISAPNIMQFYDSYTALRIAEFKIKTL